MSSSKFIIPLDCSQGIRIADIELFEKASSYFNGQSDIEMEIRKQRKDRSKDQNAYYWGVVVKMIADHCGYSTRDDMERLHDHLRGLFLKRTFTFEGRPETKILSTTSLSTVEFQNYCKEIQMWASIKLDLQIPDPNEAPIPDSYVSC